jgi:hypothetical protein
MKKGSLVILLLLASLLPLAAQQMSIEEFARLKRPPWKFKTVTVDKTGALVDFITPEKGFTFLAGGKQEAEAEEGEAGVTVKFPRKTSWITVKHPAYGQMTWKVPHGKSLKAGNHYRALLFASDPTVDYKAPKQWVVFRLDPADAILRIDSLQQPVRSDVLEYYLPVGTHSYRVEAPFYEPQEGTFDLSDSVRTDIPVKLQPFYSFLTVKTSWKGGELYIDGAHILKEEATSLRLRDGWHRVNFYWAEECFYDSLLFVGKAEKKVLKLTERDLRPIPIKRTEPQRAASPEAVAAAKVQLAPVKVTSHDPSAEIWVDLEKKGVGTWEDSLSLGFHLFEARKEGVQPTVLRMMLDDPFPKEITLEAIGTGYGLVNIHCNVAGASIRIDGKDYGETPRIVRLEATRRYKVTLSKQGYKSVSSQIPPRGNNLVDVYLSLKKKKI